MLLSVALSNTVLINKRYVCGVVVGECPPINNSTVGSCESNCNVMDVNSCNGSMICCDVGCGGVCTDNCSVSEFSSHFIVWLAR